MDNKKIGTYLFIGCIFLGTAIGLFLRKPVFGAVLGVGIGFLVKAVYMKNKQ